MYEARATLIARCFWFCSQADQVGQSYILDRPPIPARYRVTGRRSENHRALEVSSPGCADRRQLRPGHRRSLRFASDSRTSERSAIETLTKLHGVGIPVASAILTLINPDKYTIIDYRALESLGVTDWPDSVEYYLGYLAGCRELARRYNKSLRTLDRALWQWSKERSQGETCPK